MGECNELTAAAALVVVVADVDHLVVVGVAVVGVAVEVGWVRVRSKQRAQHPPDTKSIPNKKCICIRGSTD